MKTLFLITVVACTVAAGRTQFPPRPGAGPTEEVPAAVHEATDSVRHCGIVELYRRLTGMEAGQTLWVAARLEFGLPRISFSPRRIPACPGSIVAEVKCIAPDSYEIHKYSADGSWD